MFLSGRFKSLRFLILTAIGSGQSSHTPSLGDSVRRQRQKQQQQAKDSPDKPKKSEPTRTSLSMRKRRANCLKVAPPEVARNRWCRLRET